MSNPFLAFTKQTHKTDSGFVCHALDCVYIVNSNDTGKADTVVEFFIGITVDVDGRVEGRAYYIPNDEARKEAKQNLEQFYERNNCERVEPMADLPDLDFINSQIAADRESAVFGGNEIEGFLLDFRLHESLEDVELEVRELMDEAERRHKHGHEDQEFDEDQEFELEPEPEMEEPASRGAHWGSW